jgi:hypothetical protein
LTILIKLIIFTFTASIALFGSLKAVLTITSIAICFPLFNVVPIKMPIGLTGFMLVAVLISFRFLFSTIFITQSIKIGNKQFKILLGILGLFCFYSITASISFPFIFDGAVDVYPPGNSFDNGIVKVKPSISHIAQIIYITIYFIFTLWVIQESFNKKYNYLEYHRFIFVGAIVAITFSILQLFHKTLGTPFPMEILYDMPRRSGNAIEKVILNIVPRVNGSFSEASDAARYFTSIFSASLIAITFSKKTFNRCLLLLSSLCLLIAFSTTGIISISIILLTYFSIKFYNVHLPNLITNLQIPRSLPLILLIPILIFFILSNTQPELINNTKLIFTKLIIEKVNSGSFESRTGKDLLAFDILPQTYFLGIGAGSHRSGSLMGYVLANNGLPGIILFLYFLTMLILIAISNKDDKDIAVCSSAFFGFILAKSIAGPGVADDILWFTLILLLASINKNSLNKNFKDHQIR